MTDLNSEFQLWAYHNPDKYEIWVMHNKKMGRAEPLIWAMQEGYPPFTPNPIEWLYQRAIKEPFHMTPANSPEVLLPCAHCGGEAALGGGTLHPDISSYYAICTNPDCNSSIGVTWHDVDGRIGDLSRQAAIEAWNRRYTPPITFTKFEWPLPPLGTFGNDGQGPHPSGEDGK